MADAKPDEDNVEMHEPNEPNELKLSYEDERLANIKHNAALLASLGLNSPSIRPAPKPFSAIKKPSKRALTSSKDRTKRETRAKAAAARQAIEPFRRSNRVAAMSKAGHSDSPDHPNDSGISNGAYIERYKPLPKQTAPIIPSGPEYDLDSPSQPSSPAPIPARDDDGRLVFEGRWKGVFTPNLTPREMFDGGAFGGGFFCDTYSHVLHTPLLSSSDLASLPWTPSDPSTLYINSDPDASINRFNVKAGQSLQEWEKAGWIWAGDPRGWAQWYTRFWSGRRCADDERQVRRWLKVAGPTGRFKRALLKKVYQAGGPSSLPDEDVGRVLRQCLWQWGYELTLGEYEAAMSAGGEERVRQGKQWM